MPARPLIVEMIIGPDVAEFVIAESEVFSNRSRTSSSLRCDPDGSRNTDTVRAIRSPCKFCTTGQWDRSINGGFPSAHIIKGEAAPIRPKRSGPICRVLDFIGTPEARSHYPGPIGFPKSLYFWSTIGSALVKKWRQPSSPFGSYSGVWPGTYPQNG